MRVATYFNLHRRQFSIRAEEGPMKGRVIAHADRVLMHYCTLTVSPYGNARVRREGRKNVHAFIRGNLSAFDGVPTEAGESLRLPCQGQGVMHPMNLSACLKDNLWIAKTQGVSVSYNPYADKTFVIPERSRQPLPKADLVYLGKGEGVYALGITTHEGDRHV